MKLLAFPAQLFILLLLSAVVVTDSENCANGFPDASLLTNRAAQIDDNDEVGTRTQREFLYLMSHMSFNCTGNIVSLILRAEIRTITGSGNRRGNAYPTISLWRLNLEQQKYIKVDGSERDIVLNPSNFSTNGVIEYPLDPPIQIENGSILALLQQEEVVRLYTTGKEGFTTATWQNPMSTVELNQVANRPNEAVVIYPVTDFGSSCLTGQYLSEDTVRNTVVGRTRLRERSQRVFPDIHFTCNATIIEWIIGGKIGDSTISYLELQLWRRTDDDTYVRRNFSTISGFDSDEDNNVYNYFPNPPLEVKEGDILGVFQPRDQDSPFAMYYQEHSGPFNYGMMGPANAPSTSININSALDQNDYPLVSVIIEVPTLTMSLTASSSSGASMSVTQAPGTGQFPSFAPMPTDVPTPGNNVGPSDTPSASPNETSGDDVGLIVAVVVGALLFALAVTGVIVLVIVLLRGRKGSKQRTYDVPETCENTALENPVYSGLIVEDAKVPAKQAVPAIQFEEEARYAQPNLNDQSSFYAEAGMPTPYYELGMATEDHARASIYSHLEWGIVVPTAAERSEFNSGYGSIYDMDENVYSTLVQKNQQQQGSLASQHYEQAFFEESDIYWAPGGDCNSIYEQLANKKYREIIIQQIQVTGHLGSGQFGQVDRGVWHSPNGSVGVAIKTLRSSAREDEKVKFLQEAAIMGQFRHPNIVCLHGVVTMGEPIMIVLELMENGDLRKFLCSLRPTSPGEVLPSSQPCMLLDFCRQIASGMEYLSKKSFVHRDLAARNILLSSEKQCKIADFGLSRDLQDDEYYKSTGGQIPIKWTSPEALLYKRYSTASDVWSFGALMFEIWSLGHKPFEGKTNQQAFRLVKDGYRLAPPPGCPRAVYQVMIRCWHPEPSGRPSFADLVFYLSQSDGELLVWSEQDRNCHPQAAVLGASMEAGVPLYPLLQNSYIASE